MSPDLEACLSDIAFTQLEDLDDVTYDATLDAIELITYDPDAAQRISAMIRTDVGARFQLPVVGAAPLKVFWSRGDEGPRIEAIFAYTR